MKTLPELLAIAERLLERFKLLSDSRLSLMEKGLLPSDYDPNREGGFLCLFDRETKKGMLYQIGNIPHKTDEVYFTKAAKYAAYAFNKCFALHLEPIGLFSGQTKFGVNGAWVCSKEQITGFSGRSPSEDETISVLVDLLGERIANSWFHSGQVELSWFHERWGSRGNPYLVGEVFRLLTMDEESFQRRLNS